MKILTILMLLALPAPILYEGQLLYPYYCTKTWVCDYVPEHIYRTHCKSRPCKWVK